MHLPVAHRDCEIRTAYNAFDGGTHIEPETHGKMGAPPPVEGVTQKLVSVRSEVWAGIWAAKQATSGSTDNNDFSACMAERDGARHRLCFSRCDLRRLRRRDGSWNLLHHSKALTW